MIYAIAKVPIGGYCTQNEQCEGSDILGVCEHGRCVCISGYIQYNLKCLEGKLEFFPLEIHETEQQTKIIFFSVLLSVPQACLNNTILNSS